MKPIDPNIPFEEVLKILKMNAPCTVLYNGVLLTEADDESSYNKKLDGLKTGEYKVELM